MADHEANSRHLRGYCWRCCLTFVQSLRREGATAVIYGAVFSAGFNAPSALAAGFSEA